MNTAMLLLLVAFAAPILALVAGAIQPRLAPSAAMLGVAATAAVVVWSFWQPDSSHKTTWASIYGMNVELTLDGLGRLYALLATGIGFFVVAYASRYIPLHLHHQQRPLSHQTRFYFFLLLFMAAMVGLVMAQDLILLFMFWDLTAIASFFLIGYDQQEEESRSAAMMALMVTGITAVLVLIGSIMLYTEYGTFSLPAIIESGEILGASDWALLLIAIGALAKSAQTPLHFWLPRAMSAPTPVSAYLHSAAMVAAGVFLIGRFYPLMKEIDWLLDIFLFVGFSSMLVGGIIALTRNVLKQILAYSTISQYGYVVFMFGMGGSYGIKGASFYVLAHAIVKSALFLTAGAVSEATGKKNLSDIGGLRRKMPMLAIGSGFAAAGLVALPLTIGFFKDEIFFARAVELGQPYMTMDVLGASLTFAYIFRFWTHVFLGREITEAKPISGWLVWPVFSLGIITILGGVWPEPFTKIAEGAASVTAYSAQHLDVHYTFDPIPENMMAVATWTLGLTIYLTRRKWWRLATGIAHLGEKIGPAHWYYKGLNGLNALSDSVHDYEVRDLRSRVVSILVPAGVLVAIAVVITPNANSFEIGSFEQQDFTLVIMLVAAVVSGFVVMLLRDHLRLAIGLSCVGYSLAGVWAFMGAPNVTLVAVVVETILSLFFIGMLVLMPSTILRFETQAEGDRRSMPRDAIIATIAGLLVFFVSWGALSRTSWNTEVIESQTVLTTAVHARNVVTAILADFRGFDTMGEITVIAITLIGIISLLRSGRLR
ncbi:MAG: hypothetical protein M9909_05880 [Thermomicrobiales bacterium]|nr:hypothetical protein [Thermomicrobiales bacterium]